MFFFILSNKFFKISQKVIKEYINDDFYSSSVAGKIEIPVGINKDVGKNSN
jgi:hypothetical protein